ncbi:N-lysine methyltransferase SMYD2-A-like isoform X2 [Penaeus monodon]|uniref:N-lysine methyltransferase SMYD2-A-like isoform X2 n=1 Tax=Penaeus monodon TaxID=6687 RepID=UPI0018A75604|nr:N-lysine methyltransferase SMYD2-A-like isoform X2 [Penaeus monodon]
MRDIISVRALSALQKKRRLVKRGDEILTSKPFCFVLENSVIGQYCETCLATARKERLLSRCKGCWRAWYCSDICRDLGETQHRHECQLFRDRPDYRPKDFARFLARLIRKLKEGGEDVVERIDARRSRRFRDLMSHSKEIEKDQKRLDYLAEMMPDLQVLLGKSNIPEREELIQIFGKVMVNSFCLLDHHLKPVGTSLYLAASIFDHSCAPNAFVSFVGSKLVVRTLVEWPELHLDMVHISYLDTMNSREHRRTFLQDSYYFACDCRLCRDEEHARTASSIRCRSKACGTPVHVDESGTGWVDPCGACGFCKFPRGVAYEYIEVAEYTRAELADLDEENPSVARRDGGAGGPPAPAQPVAQQEPGGARHRLRQHAAVERRARPRARERSGHQALLRAQTSLRRPVPHEARQDRAQQYGVAPRPRALARGRGDPRGRPGLQPPAGVRGPDVAADPGERRVPRRHPALAHVRPSAGHVRRRPLARRQPRPQLSRRHWLPRPEATTFLLM